MAEFSAKCHSVDCSGNSKILTKLQIEVIAVDDQKSRELKRIRTRCSPVYLYHVVNTHAWMRTLWRNEEQIVNK